VTNHGPVQQSEERPFTRALRLSAAPAGVFVIVYATHLFSGVIASGDSRWYVPTALSIINEGNADLNEYPEMIEEHDYYWVDQVDAHWRTRFPIGMALLAVPFVYVLDRGSSMVFHVWPDLEARLASQCSKPVVHVNVITMYWRVELIIACFLIASAAVFVYLTAIRRLTRVRALAAVFIFAFCTSAWSTGSRSLGQHGGSILMLSIALYLLVAAERTPWLAQFSALPLAFSFVIRPTNALPILALALFVVIKHRRYTVPFFLWAAAVAVPFLWHNFSVYHAALPPYYLPQKQLGHDMHFFEALAGTLVSPNRGLFVYSPVLLFSFLGLGLRARHGSRYTLDAFLAATIAVHWIMISTFGDWWGGHSFGPRYFSDLTPFFIYLMFPALAYPVTPWNRKKIIVVACLIVLGVWSFFAHFRGATSLDTWAWNREPVEINTRPERLWDWRDLQITRGL